MKFYSSGCRKCKILKELLDDIKIEYEYITDEKTYLPIAEENGINFMPFAEIDGVIYDTKQLQQWIVNKKGNIN